MRKTDARSAPRGAKPGARHGPINDKDIAVLRLLSEGYTRRKIFEAGHGSSFRAIHVRIDRIKLKLDAVTSEQMMVLAVKRGLIKLEDGERTTE